MFEMLKKAMFTGVGLAVKTREEVEEIANDWIQRQKMSEEDGRRFMSEMMEKYDESRNKLEARIEKTVEEMLSKANIASREELDSVKEELASVKEDIALLKRAVNALEE